MWSTWPSEQTTAQPAVHHERVSFTADSRGFSSSIKQLLTCLNCCSRCRLSIEVETITDTLLFQCLPIFLFCVMTHTRASLQDASRPQRLNSSTTCWFVTVTATSGYWWADSVMVLQLLKRWRGVWKKHIRPDTCEFGNHTFTHSFALSLFHCSENSSYA